MDPYKWLEDIHGEDATAWRKKQTARTENDLTSDPRFKGFRDKIVDFLDDKDQIPGVGLINGMCYNFWQDADHVRGIWRRCTPESYETESPAWETVIDLDALCEKEGETWVWHGVSVLRYDYDRGLLSLSPGGSDASVIREISMIDGSFIEGGFSLPESKSSASWIDRDTLIVSDDSDPTDSGYPRQIRLWKRGTDLAASPVIFECSKEDLGVGGGRDKTPGYERNFIGRTISFQTSETYVADDAWTTFTKIDKPDDCGVGWWKQWILFTPETDWTVDGVTYKAGSLLVGDYEGWICKGDRTLTALFTPTERVALAGQSNTLNHLILHTLDSVRTKVYVLTPTADGWKQKRVEGLPEYGSISIGAVDDDVSDDVFIWTSDYLTPTTFQKGKITPEGDLVEVRTLKANKPVFDASGMQVEQHTVLSADGTVIPYFQINRKDIVLEGGNPTLVYAYGGFGVSMLPGYLAGKGVCWLGDGGVYVVANIRGGGEFGPSWHLPATKAGKVKSYEDLEAVAEDLIRRGVTSKEHIGVQGGSNGGLMVGQTITRRPDLWKAAVCEVPLLDMRVYNKLLAGASWEDEYGNPDDPEQWDGYLHALSPYHQVRDGVKYPTTLYTTSTRDDRVHPGHARKMAAKMLDKGQDVWYLEWDEGGHSGGSTTKQIASRAAMTYIFLWKNLA